MQTTGQMMSSVRLYLLPEYTAEGRQPHHGEDELVAVSEKSVLRVPDLLDWLVTPTSSNLTWDRGTRGVASKDCQPPSSSSTTVSLPDHKLGPGPGLDLSDIEKIRTELGDEPGSDEVGVLVLSSSQYCRFRAVIKRLDGCHDKWLRNSLVVALGGFATRTRNTFVMFAKETFDYPELEEHPLLCNHLAPKLKGRPRKRRKLKEVTGAPNSPEGSEHESNSSEGSNCSGVQKQPQNAKSRKDLLAILSQKNTKEETEFLKKLIKFMEERNTPIERPPMLGFKQIDLHMFFQKVSDQGGYDGCVSKKAWKLVYDELGGNPQNTSAATCTRRHYEKFLLSYERYSKNMELDGEDIKLKHDDIDNEDSQFDKQPNGTNGIKDALDDMQDASKSESDNKDEVANDVIEDKAEKSVENKPKENFTPKIGIKPLQLLTEPKPADNNVGLEKEDVKLKIDDLIIIPNNINHVEEGGSALQNLAKIASRYSSLNKDKSRSQEFSSPSPKKARVEDTKPSVAQPLPANTATKKNPAGGPAAVSTADLSSSAASSLLQQFSLLSPGMFPGWPGPGSLSPSPAPAGQSSGSPTSRSSSNPSSTVAGAGSAAAAASWLGSGLHLDPSKIGQDGYNLLKYYEQQLKALQSGTSSAPKANGLKDTSPTKKDSKSKEKSKVCKLPPDTKRPPRLIQTPCPYSQTASIYGSPKSELQKARDSASKSNSSPALEANSKQETTILDLSSSSKDYQHPREYSVRTPVTSTPTSSYSSPTVRPSTATTDATALNLSRLERSSDSYTDRLEKDSKNAAITTTSDMTMDLSIKSSSTTTTSASQRLEVKASPFSAEALLSKPNNNHSSKNDTNVVSKSLPPLSMGIKGILEPDIRRNSPQPSPALPRASPSSANQSPGPRVTSPWHSPAMLTSSSKPQAGPGPVRSTASSTAAAAASAASLAALYSAGYLGAAPPTSSIPGLSTETTFSSLSSLSSSSLAPPTLPQGSNPYLSALMSPSLHGPAAVSAKSPAAIPGAPPGFPGLNPLDPASQYYAALYQQQLSAYQHAAAAAAMNPYGIRPGYAPPAGANAAAAAAELQALQQYKDMMTRAALAGSPAASQAQAAQAAAAAGQAANPYAALYGLMGYPGGFPGSRKDS